MTSPHSLSPSKNESRAMLFFIFLRLGCIAFGGPIAHLSYFRDEFVRRRQWLSEQCYADLVAMCQFLPGPASSQVGMAIGIFRHGYWGAVLAWAGFTLPSAIALIIFALGISHDGTLISTDVLHGLKLAAVAVVAHAVWGMARTLCIGWERVLIMTLTACAALLFAGVQVQLFIMLSAGIVGLLLIRPAAVRESEHLPVAIGRRAGFACLGLFFVLLFALPLLAKLFGYRWIADISAFYRVGALVFGGGHVVLPLLQVEVVPTGLVSNDVFLAGYGAAQAVPGPLFTFAAFLGAAMNQAPSGVAGGFICLLSIFAPSFLLVVGAIPFWDALRRNLRMQAVLAGINAAVVGLLLAAFYHPVWTGAIHQPVDVVIASLAFIVLVFRKMPAWLIVALCVVSGVVLPLFR